MGGRMHLETGETRVFCGAKPGSRLTEFVRYSSFECQKETKLTFNVNSVASRP